MINLRKYLLETCFFLYIIKNFVFKEKGYTYMYIDKMYYLENQIEYFISKII